MDRHHNEVWRRRGTVKLLAPKAHHGDLDATVHERVDYWLNVLQ